MYVYLRDEWRMIMNGGKTGVTHLRESHGRKLVPGQLVVLSEAAEPLPAEDSGRGNRRDAHPVTDEKDDVPRVALGARPGRVLLQPAPQRGPGLLVPELPICNNNGKQYTIPKQHSLQSGLTEYSFARTMHQQWKYKFLSLFFGGPGG